ncbi:hypothetical protein AGMMS5026_07810 [Endomicrobiia bacterium]|nr:hypothetical protein AGMMS49523_03330 [Endomicrobiia bacterium]GHT12217.1 hypothetical protein AGMMS49571_03840 [Endomicrobiia bacterium]GHT20565.1 hypothetical protein AGMMS49929_07550 [Endomicrobiia bacterium]GHT26145.1 hypothetical protein AGMMS49995_02140 [Endomicrobiia bacterium]GHT31447.1 hypothetical protein AGMMS5026_07810 [Endomicrobiia bacterium]
MAEKVQKVGVERESGYLYFVDKQGDVSRALMARGRKKGGKVSKVKKFGVDKEAGYFYFIDKQGDISRSSMNRGEKDKTKKTVKKVVEKSARKGKKK